MFIKSVFWFRQKRIFAQVGENLSRDVGPAWWDAIQHVLKNRTLIEGRTENDQKQRPI